MKHTLLVIFVLLRAPLLWAQAVIVPSPVPSCSNGDVLQWVTASTNFACTPVTTVNLPLTDAAPGLLKNASDATKIFRINVAAITTGTTRTWTIADANITVPSTIASLAANTFTGLQTANGGVAATTITSSSTTTVATLISAASSFTGDATVQASNTLRIGYAANIPQANGEAPFLQTYGTDSRAGQAILRASADANSAGIYIAKSRSATIAGAGTGIVVAEDSLGQIEWSGDDGTDVNTVAASINVKIDATPGANDMPGRMVFSVTADGAAAPTAALSIYSTKTMAFHGYGAGTATFDASGNLTAVSDERMKDIQGQFTSGLNALLGIHPILYKYKASSGLDTENIYAGFSAQNVLRYIPEAVGKNLNGFYSLNIVPVLAATVTAIQELAIEIDQLRAVVKMTAKSRNAAPVMDEKRVVNSATPKRLAEIAKQKTADDKVRADTESRRVR